MSVSLQNSTLSESVEQTALAHGFTLREAEDLPEVDGQAFVLDHEASGAQLLYLKNDDPNKAFAISFKTPAADDTGVFHILEHSVLCGSSKFPVKEPFVNLLKSSMQTFLNAMTFPDKTMYPVASTNEQDLMNLMDVYLDAVFHPAIYQKEAIFQQEGWHLEWDDTHGLAYNGVVYNEMKGALSDPDGILYNTLSAALFPDTTYRFESGGTPESIPTLTYEAFIDTHRRHYRPDNSYITLYGDLDLDPFLEFIDGHYLAPLAAKDRPPLDINPLTMQRPVIAEGIKHPMNTAPENACVALGYVVGTASDRKRQIAVDILLDAIMGSNEAPMKRAILDAGLASDTSAYLSDSVLQPFAVFQLKGAKPNVAQAFADLVREEAARLADGGLDHTLIEAALSHSEFVMREHNFGMSDGVVLAMTSMSSWLYDDQLPIASLRYEDTFRELREELEEGYFESLLEELILTNDHRASVEVVPSSQDDETAVRADLEELSRTLSTEEKEAICADVELLRQQQETPDSQTALKTLPTLPISALTEAPVEPEYHLIEDTPLPCLRHTVHTRGIVYAYRYFNLNHLAYEDLPYAFVLAMMLGKLDTTDHTAAELDTLTQGTLGNLSFFTEVTEDTDNAASYRVQFVVGSSALSSNVRYLATLPNEILTRTLFSDTAKMKDILTQKRVGFEQTCINAGHTVALGRVSSYYSQAALIRESLGGLDFYFFLKDLLLHFDERADFLCHRLEEISQSIFTDDSCLISFAGTDEEMDSFWNAGVLLGRASWDMAAETLSAPEAHSKHEAIIVPSDVTYTAMGYDRRLLNASYNGTWLLASRILSYDFLWNEVRVKGGAYGTGFQTTRPGNLRFYSYRDPHVDETIETFGEAGRWLSSFEPTKTEFDGYIVSTTAGIDAPLKARDLIRRQDGQYFCHYSPERRLETRRQVVEATTEQVRSLGKVIEEVTERHYVCCVGNRDLILKSDEDFTHVDLLKATDD